MARGAPIEERQWPHRVSDIRHIQIPLPLLVGHKAPHGIAVLRHGGVQVHHRVHSLRYSVGRAGDHHSSVAVPDQHRILDFLRFQQAHHILDMRFEVHRGMQ
jgi:hypothetical protein